MVAPQRVSNPPNPYASESVEWLDLPPEIKLEVFEEHAHSIISRNDSPDIGFTHSINPYRGCFHGCAYCYARRTHHYIDFGAGTDFERKIVVKINAAEKLREEFNKKSWRGEVLVFSGVTDCYQPLEASYELTRRCLEVCAEFKNPVSMVTKGALVWRDIDIFELLKRDAYIKIHMSIAFSDDAMSREIEPYAPRPSIRFRAMKELSEAGIPVGIGVAPVIPGLNDDQIPEILERARDHGATTAFITLLRLPGEVSDVFIERLHASFPSRARRVLSQLKDMKKGKLNRTEFGERMTGTGARWEMVEWLFHSTCERLGLNKHEPQNHAPLLTFQRPTYPRPTSQFLLPLG